MYPVGIDDMYKQYFSVKQAWTATAQLETKQGASYQRVGLFCRYVLYKTDLNVPSGDVIA